MPLIYLLGAVVSAYVASRAGAAGAPWQMIFWLGLFCGASLGFL
jgi:hypothetical protein